MAKRDYPTPCIRPVQTPAFARDPSVPASWVYESPAGLIVPLATENEAREYVLDNKIHRKYGRCFIETAPKKFATLIVDDRGDEEEASFEE